MELRRREKILFTKGDIAAMLSTSRGVFRIACESLGVQGIDWKSKKQRFTDDEVFEIIKKLRRRLTDAEIDTLIRENSCF